MVNLYKSLDSDPKRLASKKTALKSNQNTNDLNSHEKQTNYAIVYSNSNNQLFKPNYNRAHSPPGKLHQTTQGLNLGSSQTTANNANINTHGSNKIFSSTNGYKSKGASRDENKKSCGGIIAKKTFGHAHSKKSLTTKDD